MPIAKNNFHFLCFSIFLRHCNFHVFQVKLYQLFQVTGKMIHPKFNRTLNPFVHDHFRSVALSLSRDNIYLTVLKGSLLVLFLLWIQIANFLKS